ncbi:PREDICTED: transcription factor HES-4-like [Nanorana parkeri]|uniref:transcription factor HES-4-like n=1 Tax=Nanorana parkeri TaxID=125878 RepID=UPI000854FB1E|nr:PREDICTED: transcription factor HES-4-like [Nanorana parkeri]
MRERPAVTLATYVEGTELSPAPRHKDAGTCAEARKTPQPGLHQLPRKSLGQLKTLILDALKKDSSRHSKLEKADILEMTVKHLRNLQRVQMTAALTADPSVLGKYRAGFNECMNEVTRFLSTCEGVNTEVRTRLLGHLSGCLGQIVAMNYQQSASSQPLHVQLPSAPVATAPVPMPCKMTSAESLSPKVFQGGFQLLPATDGQYAFLIPNPAYASSPGPVIPLYANGNITSSGAPQAHSPIQGLTTFPHKMPHMPQTVSPLGGSSGPDSMESVWRPW